MRHTGIVVKDLNKSIAFYRNLGFHPVEGSLENWQGKDLLIMKMGSLGGTLELVQGLWKPHIAINTNRLDELSWGHDVVDRPKHRVCFIQDHDGNWVELVEEK